MGLLGRSRRETRLLVLLMGKSTYSLIYLLSHDIFSAGVLRLAILRYISDSQLVFQYCYSLSPTYYTLHTPSDIAPTNQVPYPLHRHRTVLSSTSLARLPFNCAIRRSFRLTVARHRLEITSLATVIVAFIYARFLLASRAASNARVPNLVSLTLERLATQATLHAQDKEGVPESWISIGQLRDDVLRDEHSISKREALWKKVRAVVEMNANVRSSQREGRNGEISRVWEWIGAVGNLESGEKRR